MPKLASNAEILLIIAFSQRVDAFAVLSNQILEPYGYSEDTAGFMVSPFTLPPSIIDYLISTRVKGAALLLSGILAAFATSPIFDRILTHHLGVAAQVFTPFVAAGWLSLIWAVRENNVVALYALFIIIGVFSVAMLPVGLELGCELTRNADASSAILWLR